MSEAFYIEMSDLHQAKLACGAVLLARLFQGGLAHPQARSWYVLLSAARLHSTISLLSKPPIVQVTSSPMRCTSATILPILLIDLFWTSFPDLPSYFLWNC